MANRSYTNYGVRIALALPFIALGALAIVLALTYDGTCGGFAPWIAAARPCTLAQYLAGSVTVLALILVKTYWAVLPAFIALPIAIGYALDRRRRGLTP